MSRARSLAATLIAALGCGCLGPMRVQVLHLLPESRETASRSRAAEPLLVWVARPAEPGAVEEAHASGRTVRPGVRARRLAAMVSGALAGSGVRVAGHCAGARDEEAGPALAALTPGSVLRITVLSLKASAPDNGAPYEASLEAAVRLVRHPSGEELDGFSETVKVARAPAGPGKGLPEWYEENEKELFAALAGRLSARYAVRVTARQRPVLARFDVPDSARALEAARKGDWAGAEVLWARGEDWRDALGLAVAAERRKDYGRALVFYEKAKAGGESDPEGRELAFDEMVGDVRWALGRSSAPAAAESPWFSGRLAVGALSDGPARASGLARALVAESLEGGGYAVAAEAEPGAADLVLAGEVSGIDEFESGAGGRRSVKGRLSLADARTGRELWACRAAVDSLAGLRRPLLPPALPLSRALRALLDRSALGYEVQVFVERCMESLPMKPPPAGEAP